MANKYTIDIERVFSDIRSYEVSADSLEEAAEQGLKIAMRDAWNWPSAHSFSVIHAEKASNE